MSCFEQCFGRVRLLAPLLIRERLIWVFVDVVGFEGDQRTSGLESDISMTRSANT